MTRRMISLLLAALMIFSLAACGSSQTQATGTPAEEDAEALRGQIEQDFPQCELEMLAGGQPLYYYLFSVE